MRGREVISNGFAVLGSLICLVVAVDTAGVVRRAMATGVVRNRYGGVYLRSEEEFFFYVNVALHAIASVMSLSLVVFVVVMVLRETRRR